ncbi:hypothetical protein SDC9_82960 [bioreactor metagenome]|uniref:Uncharacterized protein n=1 Tax=bioreactor metagenome TaxID=1076179 RepID=A0A644ZER1_9ZZZZ
MNKNDNPHSTNQKHGVAQNRAPLILLFINNGTGCAENFNQRNDTQDNKYQPYNFIALEDFHS